MPARMMSARGGAAPVGEVSVADSPLATFESLTQAAVIAVMGIAIVVSNLLIIAAFLNFKGKFVRAFFCSGCVFHSVLVNIYKNIVIHVGIIVVLSLYLIVTSKLNLAQFERKTC